MSIYEYEVNKWREHQSKMTKFLDVLDKNRNEIHNSDTYVLKLIELNTLLDTINNLVDEIKYECIYPNKKQTNVKHIKRQIQAHLDTQSRIKKTVVFSNLLS